MSDGIRCMWMRGGTSKGGYFLAEDLPLDPAERNALLLRIMGSPDLRQIDGMGGADPLTSKVAVVRASNRAGVDVDYLFLQVFEKNQFCIELDRFLFDEFPAGEDMLDTRLFDAVVEVVVFEGVVEVDGDSFHQRDGGIGDD